MKRYFALSWRDTFVTAGILGLSVLLCVLLRLVDADTGESSVTAIFFLAVFLTARFTTGYFYGTLAAFISVLAINFLFTYPYMEFNFALAGYPLTILCTLTVAVITGTLITRVKAQERVRSENEKERLRSNLLRSVSHDFRTPLTSIMGGTSVLIENDSHIDPEERLRLLHSVHDDARWLLRIVENLLSITRMESTGGTVKIDLRPEPVEELLENAISKFRRNFPNRTVRTFLPEDFFLVAVDPLLIEQVLLNLLENSVRHGIGSTFTGIAVRSSDGKVSIEIFDDGCGISEKQLPHIFEGKGHSPETTSDNKRNMGIGLSVCQSIITAHHGTLSAENRPEGGALFRFTLPLED